MDQLLAHGEGASPTAPEFREALIKRLGEAPIKSGEAFDSNGPDFIWAVEAAASRRSSSTTSRSAPCAASPEQPVVPHRRSCASARRIGSTT